MRAVLLLLILIQVRGKTIQACPKFCTCKLGAQAEWLRVKCGNELQNIKDIDIDSVSVELIQLDLSKNSIYGIESNIFKNLMNLKRLNLSQNDITYLGEGCFNGLGNLERLDLSKNQISTIDAYAFKKLTSLKRLDLSHNNITVVRATLFHDLLALDCLKLNENKLTTLKEGIFYGLKSLKQLDLSNNPWRCDCELYWFSSWIHNSSIKLNSAPKCVSPTRMKGELVKKLKYSENIQCQWLPPTIELQPFNNQVVFAGDSITLKCRAPSITEDRNAKLSWLWYPNTTSEIADLDVFIDPQKSLSNIKIDNRYLADSGIVDSSLSIVSVKEEHNGQWNCLLVSTNGNRSRAISVIVISDETRYCPLAVTKNNKGIYTWPKTVVGWRAELPCEGNHLSTLMQTPLKASYQCNITGHWEDLNTEVCPYISQTTKSLEQFSKVNLSLTKISLLETAKKFKNYTGNSVQITDPVDVNFITQTIENYLNFLMEEKELGSMLIDVINSIISIPKNILKKAEIAFKSCSRLIRAVEKIIEFTPYIQFYKKDIALEEFRIKRDTFTGLMCTWYSNNNPEIRFLQCTTNNRSSPINVKDKVIEASINLPASLLQHSQEPATHHLMISAYSNNKLFPITNNDDNTNIASCVIGSKLYGIPMHNLTEPVYVMLKVPFYHYTGRKLLPVVWDETLNESGGWTSDGCYIRNVLSNLIIFHCDRLGYYALLQDTSLFDQNGNSILGAKFRYSNPAIYIGSIATITCLIIMSVTYIICYSSITMPKKAKHCVINTWFAMALLSFFYTIGIYQTENVPICQGVGLTLHYLSLCPLLWMSVFASNMYKKLTKSDLKDIPDSELPDQPIPKPLLGLYLVGWGIAMIICGISGAINLREYAGYSYCFLTTGPALAALFFPAVILILCLIIFHLLIKCAIQNVDMNGQLSEGTQTTENMDLELLEPNTNLSAGRDSACSARTVSSDIEDSEHSQITQLKGQIITLFLYLISWIAAAAATAKPLSPYIPFDETMFATLYSFFSSSLGIFILFFYGIARNDVRSQWLKMRCWFKNRKNRCCRTRSISDVNPAIPTQPLVQNLVPAMSNSQATQVTSDSNSVGSSRYTHRSQTSNAFKFAGTVTNQEVLPVARKMTNLNLVVLHRQQYRSDNSVTTYTEPTCVEMFYNPHQSGVARKFFKKQRRHTKNNNLGPRKQGDGGAMSDAGSCTSIPRPIRKLESNIDQTILSSSAKVNNTNIHVELNPINDMKNVNILSDSGGSISEERNVPVRFVIGQEGLFRNARKVNNNCRINDPINAVSNFSRNNYQKKEALNTIHDSDTDIKTDEEKQMQSVMQQYSLEYSSEVESIAPMNSEKGDHSVSETYEAIDIAEMKCLKKDCQSANMFREIEEQQPNATLTWLSHSNSMHCLPIDTAKLSRNHHSLNDIASLSSLKSCECLKSFSDLQSVTSSNLCDKSSLSQKSFNKLELPVFKLNRIVKDNLHNLVQTTVHANPPLDDDRASNVCTDEYRSKEKFVNSVTNMKSFIQSPCNIVKNLEPTSGIESINEPIETSKVQLNNPNTYTQLAKKETSV
ncbi:adhesion G protein-coupled receptor A3 isoform X2 [Ceratina calcarata]|nr:adhesion G protein-coupled receptor A3 isoform X2 [Ceratina calcarata]XP_026668476.1 adhesion G protein-coupled receptor A3 isoform X2 [Ceratina calcarata]